MHWHRRKAGGSRVSAVSIPRTVNGCAGLSPIPARSPTRDCCDDPPSTRCTALDLPARSRDGTGPRSADITQSAPRSRANGCVQLVISTAYLAFVRQRVRSTRNAECFSLPKLHVPLVKTGTATALRKRDRGAPQRLGRRGKSIYVVPASVLLPFGTPHAAARGKPRPGRYAQPAPGSRFRSTSAIHHTAEGIDENRSYQ